MKRVFAFLVVVLISMSIVSGQSEPSVQSIFDYDTCAPPCWMGLILGESSATDVDHMLEANQDLIDPDEVAFSIARLEDGELAVDSETGEVIRATYTFRVGESYHGTTGTTSRIEIQEGLLHAIVILAHTKIPLSDVIVSLPEPNIVRLNVGNSGATRLALIYLDLQLRINLIQPTATCDISNLYDGLAVSSVSYLSDESSVELGRFASDIMQPRLTAYRLSNERDVPLDLWQEWLSGDVDMSCEDAWALLPEPEITPVPEATITPEITDHPTPSLTETSD